MSIHSRRRFDHDLPFRQKYLFFCIIPLSRVGARRIEGKGGPFGME
jgi:hypothetical protein